MRVVGEPVPVNWRGARAPRFQQGVAWRSLSFLSSVALRRKSVVAGGDRSWRRRPRSSFWCQAAESFLPLFLSFSLLFFLFKNSAPRAKQLPILLNDQGAAGAFHCKNAATPHCNEMPAGSIFFRIFVYFLYNICSSRATPLQRIAVIFP